MADTDILVSEMTPASQINTTDLMIMTQSDSQAETGYSTKSGTVLQVANKMLKGTDYATDLPDFTDQNVLGGLEELKSDIKSLLPIETASGNPCNFETGITDKLVSLKAAILASGGNGTPSTPIPIVGHSELNLVRTSENLFTSMVTATNDGITTSYDSSTGYISITNDSRTTNYGSGSMRGTVVTGLNSAHTYKYLFVPNVTGVVLCDENSLALTNEFTGITSAKLKITNTYDFVNDHPIGDTTSVKLLIVDITEGSYTPYLVSFGQTVYGGVYDANRGKLRLTHGYLALAVADMNNSNDFPGWTNSGIRQIVGANVQAYPDILGNVGFVIGVNTNGSNDILFLPKTSYNNLTQSDWIANYPDLIIQMVIPLATPIEIDVSELSVESVSGVNNIVSDGGGDVEVQYRDSIQHYIDSKIASVQALIL